MKTLFWTTTAIVCHFLSPAESASEYRTMPQEVIHPSFNSTAVDDGTGKIWGFPKEESEQLVENILEDLTRMKIITDSRIVSFTLSNNKLVVNDVKQPAEVLEKFRIKYHIVEGYSISYSRNDHQTSTSIVKEK